jgi:hypothetical protein
MLPEQKSHDPLDLDTQCWKTPIPDKQSHAPALNLEHCMFVYSRYEKGSNQHTGFQGRQAQDLRKTRQHASATDA